MQRFPLVLPARIESNGAPMALSGIDAFSRDVSAGGGFFLTVEPFGIGTRVVVRMLILPQQVLLRSKKKAQVTVSGEVLRADGDGMAVRFDKTYRMVSVND